MSEQEGVNQDAVIEEFDSSWFETTNTNEGGGFLRHPYGDFRGRITDAKVESSKGPKPHNMLVISTITIGVIEDGDASAIGMSQDNRYGTPQSPKFMQERAACLLMALGQRGPFRPKDLIGREYDYTVTWEKSAPITDAVGNEKVFVNSRLCFERKKGAPLPAKAKAKALSAVAIKHLLEVEGVTEEDNAEGGSVGAEGAWEKSPAGGAAAKADKADTKPVVTSTAGKAAKVDTTKAGKEPEWLPEDKVMKTAHIHRALIAMGDEKAAAAEKQLIGKKIDPRGPIDPANLVEPVKAAYATWLSEQKAAAPEEEELPDLDAPEEAAPAPASKAKTGTRTK